MTKRKNSEKPLFAFFGTPQLSVTVLDALERHGLIPALVVTAPDKERGRGLTLSPSPVKAWALAHGIDVITPETLKDDPLRQLADGGFLAELSNTDWDVFVVMAYNKLIPKNILDIPRRGALNIHPSLLPKFRGPSPVLSAILADERSTGVSIMQMSEKMDAGPIIAQARVELEESEWPPKGKLFEELLATEGANLLAEILPDWLAGTITPEPQDDSKATFTKKFSDLDALIDLNDDARNNLLKIRAFDHGPRAYFLTPEGKRVIITDAEIMNGELKIIRVIPESKKEQSYADFLRS